MKCASFKEAFDTAVNGLDVHIPDIDILFKGGGVGYISYDVLLITNLSKRQWTRAANCPITIFCSVGHCLPITTALKKDIHIEFFQNR